MKKPVLELMKEIGIINDFKKENNTIYVNFKGKIGVGEYGSNQFKYMINFDCGSRIVICLKAFIAQEQSFEQVKEIERIQSVLRVA